MPAGRGESGALSDGWTIRRPKIILAAGAMEHTRVLVGPDRVRGPKHESCRSGSTAGEHPQGRCTAPLMDTWRPPGEPPRRCPSVRAAAERAQQPARRAARRAVPRASGRPESSSPSTRRSSSTSVVTAELVAFRRKDVGDRRPRRGRRLRPRRATPALRRQHPRPAPTSGPDPTAADRAVPDVLWDIGLEVGHRGAHRSTMPVRDAAERRDGADELMETHRFADPAR